MIGLLWIVRSSGNYAYMMCSCAGRCEAHGLEAGRSTSLLIAYSLIAMLIAICVVAPGSALSDIVCYSYE